MKTSINKLRTELQELILANGNINRFYWKDLNRAMAENRDINYPLVCAFYPTATLTMNQDRIQLTIDVADKIYQDYTNLNDVESDTLNICRQLFNGLQSVRWKKIGRIESCTVRKFVATHSDFVAGHSMTIDFNLRDLNGVCDLPFFNYDFEQVVSGEATQVTVFNSDMSYSQLVDCGSNLELPDVSYLVKNSIDDVLAGATVPSVNNIETTLADVDNIDSDGSTVPTPAGVAFTCTPQIVCSDATAVLKDTDDNIISSTDIPSGDTQDIIAPDATATLNGNAFGNVPSGVTVDIELVDQTDTPIIPDSVVGNKITVTIPVPVNIDSAQLLRTFQTAPYAVGDDGTLQIGRLVDWFTLNSNNPFGNTNRWTDELGGQTYANNIVIDWSTFNGAIVLGYYRVILNYGNWATSVPLVPSLSVATFTSGWRMTNQHELWNILYRNVTPAYNYAPFNFNTIKYFWTSTTHTDGVQAIIDQGTYYGLSPFAKSFVLPTLACRNFTVTGTTLT